MKKYFVILILFSLSSVIKSQVLISLLLGDKLNSDKVEFGLDGGINFSNMANMESGKSKRTFNLGFYFDLKLKQQLILHTGVIVKSTMGADKIDPYILNDINLDNLFADGYITRKINYFNVPILIKYRFAEIFHIEAGPMLGLRTSAKDIFVNEIVDKEDLTYKLDTRDQYKRIDAGIMGGVGLKLSKVPKSAQAGIRYYYGFVDPLKDNPGKVKNNSSLYLYISIPIGAKKAAAN